MFAHWTSFICCILLSNQHTIILTHMDWFVPKPNCMQLLFSHYSMSEELYHNQDVTFSTNHTTCQTIDLSIYAWPSNASSLTRKLNNNILAYSGQSSNCNSSNIVSHHDASSSIGSVLSVFHWQNQQLLQPFHLRVKQ